MIDVKVYVDSLDSHLTVLVNNRFNFLWTDNYFIFFNENLKAFYPYILANLALLKKLFPIGI
jgi:hypothetical protein